MELINECSIRFAEDKDFRLLVGFREVSAKQALSASYRLSTVSWLFSEPITLGEVN